MKKTVQVMMLPTTQNNIEQGQLFNCYSKLGIARGSFLDTQDYKPQHLYFTSNEEISTGDNYINIITMQPDKAGVCWGLNPHLRKVVATTDKSLNLPLIPQSFIEEYVKSNGEIKEVELPLTINDNGTHINYEANTYLDGSAIKQTLEEAAEESVLEYLPLIQHKEVITRLSNIFIAGAKWQQSNS